MNRTLNEQEATTFLLRNKERIYGAIRELRTELQDNIKFLQENSDRLSVSASLLIQSQISEWKKVLTALEGF